MEPYHIHECEECDGETVYPLSPYESEGDVVEAYCGSCGENTQHVVGAFEMYK